MLAYSWGQELDGFPRPIPGHSLAFAVIGTFILWFGFNAGSTLSAHELRI
ncbi:MAG: hypothetical protein DRP01_10640 [Archaeoglobales archaeon]|nr:MAG: hypothetical protein DRP01_10640 [Archaeoglobales archaeon]